MAIDKKEIDTVEDSMVHDIDEEPHPEGWGIYVTLRFLSKVVLGVYGLMLLGMIFLQIALRENTIIPIFMMPESVLTALPLALVAGYLYMTSEPEPGVLKKRTRIGRLVTFTIVFLVMQLFAILGWVGLAKIFSLH